MTLRPFFFSVLGLTLTMVNLHAQADSAVTRLALIGCHRQDRPAPALLSYVKAKPQVALWVGDNVYADTKDDPNFIRRCYAQLTQQPGFKELRAMAEFVPVWDDHDYGLDNMGKHYPLKEESKEIFRSFWGVEKYVPADRSGVYHARYFGEGEEGLQILMLDGRYNRDNEGPNGDTLGEEQWKWLEQELRKPAALRLIVSGYQVFLDRSSKFETWAKFPKAQARLFKLIRDTNAKRVVFIAGDQHYGEVGRLKGALGYDAVEIMFAGINQEEPHVYYSNRVSPVSHAKDSYGLIDIQWKRNKLDRPHLLFRAFDARTDKAEITYRLNFHEIE